MYVYVKKILKLINIKIYIETGEEFSIQNDVVTCRLNFRRRPFLVKTYIRNHVFNFNYLFILKLYMRELNLITKPILNEAMVLIFRCLREFSGTNMARV